MCSLTAVSEDLLFDVPESLSPRVAWLRQHGLILEHRTDLCEEEIDCGATPWVCRIAKESGCFAPNEIGGGNTEEDAIWDFCMNSGIKHYNLP